MENDVTPKAVERVTTTEQFNAAALVEHLPELSFFEVLEVIKDKVRKHHKERGTYLNAPTQSMICSCGLKTGGPYGTEACDRLRRVNAAIHNLDAEISRWAAEEQDESEQDVAEGDQS